MIPTPGNLVEDANWDQVIEEFTQLIDQSVKGPIAKWMVPQFSTTTSKDRLIGRVALIGAMKDRFMTLCGIPSVTLEGTLKDWESLLQRHMITSNRVPLEPHGIIPIGLSLDVSDG